MRKPDECSSCVLVNIGSSFTQCEGEPRLGVDIVGESAGKHEAQEGLPFRPNGESGSLITHVIEHITVIDPSNNIPRKMRRSDFRWDNIVKCRPPGDVLSGANYAQAAIEACSVYNNRSFARLDTNEGYTKVILALGVVAFSTLTGVSGKRRGIEDVRGYCFASSDNSAIVIGSLHPSFIRHGNSRKTSALIYDVKKALLVASGKYRSYSNHSSFIHPLFVLSGRLEALVALYYRLRDNPELILYYDIENNYTRYEEEDDKGELEDEDTGNKSGNEITSIQFATDKTWALLCPWEKPYIKVALAILALPNVKVGANVWHHDNPRLENDGARIGGVIHDAMWAWHHIQPGLWKGLQRIGSFFDVPFAWKHLSLDAGNEDEYGCMDVISLAYIWPSLVEKMKRVGVWESYLKFKVEYRVKVLRPTEIRGLFVDKDEHANFKTWVQQEVTNEDTILQNEIPRELRNIKPTRKDKTTGEISYGYIREPPAIKLLRPGYELTRAGMLARGIQDSDILPFGKYATRKTGLCEVEFEQGNGDVNGPRLGDTVRRWCNYLPFKASSQQLIKYMRFKGYKIPRTLKENKETTGKKELQEVWERTNDELLGSVIRIRSYHKMLSNDIPNWVPGKDGKVHTTFGFDPASGQLNAFKPNILNASKHTPLGVKFRQIVKAPSDYCIVEIDKSAFHVVMIGYCAKDPLYIKWAKVDMHSLLTSYIVNDPIRLDGEPDVERISYIKKKFKVVRNTQAKPLVLGNNLGLGARKLFHMNKTYLDENGVRRTGIESEKKAKRLQDLIAHMFPKIEKFKKRITEEAHFKSCLMSEFKTIRWFYDVLKFDYKSRSMKHGSEYEAAISHPVQANAFGEIHSEIIEMGEAGLLDKYNYAMSVHDSVVFFPRWEDREKCIAEVSQIMLAKSRTLIDPICAPEGLVTGIEVMISNKGGSWSEMQEVKL